MQSADITYHSSKRSVAAGVCSNDAVLSFHTIFACSSLID